MRGAGKAIAAVLCVTFASACIEAPPEHVQPPPPPPPSYSQGGGAAMPAEPVYGVNDDAEYARGERDGRMAGAREPVVGYFCAGVGVGIALPLVLIAVFSDKGGGNCNGCGGGVCEGGSGGSTSAVVGGGYAAGYHSGFDSAHEQRKDRAMITGFLTGLAIFAVGCGIYLADPNNRQKVQDTTSNPNPSGAVLLRF